MISCRITKMCEWKSKRKKFKAKPSLMQHLSRIWWISPCLISSKHLISTTYSCKFTIVCFRWPIRIKLVCKTLTRKTPSKNQSRSQLILSRQGISRWFNSLLKVLKIAKRQNNDILRTSTSRLRPWPLRITLWAVSKIGQQRRLQMRRFINTLMMKKQMIIMKGM